MPLLTYSPKDYALQFMRLLPRGRVWHRGLPLVEDADIETLMPTWARLQVRLNDLIADIFPCSTTGLLPEWEASLGLPDDCIGPLPTFQQRQAAVCAKFYSRGGQSVLYFVKLANLLGYDARVVQFAPFRVGMNAAGDHLYGEDWAFAWAIIVPQTVVTYFQTGISRAGEPLRAWGDKTLECLIAQYQPSHTIPIIAYSLSASLWDQLIPPPHSIWDDGASVWDEGELLL
jgi:uncharacterized protein YmfQ (DUF2313 family)